MSRQRYIWHNNDWVEIERFTRAAKPVAPMLIRDIQPYRSVVTREVIGGRKQHRDHLRAHNCIEVGNEKLTPRPATLSRAERVEDIKRAMGD